MIAKLGSFSLLLNLISSVSAASFISVTGASSPGNPVPLRRSITELAAEAGPQWDLYIQALRSLYDRDTSDPESFFQIAGIHGRPFIEWNNTGPMNTNGWGGYSTHGENLFIIWHRPFVTLFEQTLVKEAKNLAAGYPDQYRAVYEQAADHLRAPYWDWALEPWLPQSVLPETITINAASKTGIASKTIDNPLFTYKFTSEVMQGKFGEFNTYDRMYRCSNPNSANQNLYSRNYKSWLYDTFTRAKSFSEFATTASSGSSLEGIHNTIHWDAGCGGQFMDSQYSAFEPLFMLHHSNVDRLWAYWQAMHPEASTFNGRYQCLSRFSTLGGTLTSLDSPLQPFKQANGDWHTSNSVNSIKSFGYSYSGLEYWTMSEAELQQSAVELINNLYGPVQQQKPGSTSSQTKATTTATASSSVVRSSSTQQTSSKPSASSSSIQVSSSESSASSSSPTATSSAQDASSSGTVVNSNATTTMISTTKPVSTTLVVTVSEGTPAIPTGTSSVAPGPGQPSQSNNTETDSNKRFYVDISVDVSYLPVRPCAIEISIEMWRAGVMAIMQMPATGVLHDSISLSDAIVSAGLNKFPDDEILGQIMSRLHVTLRKADDSTIDISTLSGLQIKIDEMNFIPAASTSELPQLSKSKSQTVVDAPVKGCAAPA
ncbi:hypothetical protein NQ176_g7180 [Zarea fungicola]|uniref:Uncharacterized protein n=1 Tax=Zarea fungicola TaxID=93591 RepID=A0ACC1MZH6_9HYPO|nr:hypothetical protein NQ176_g7180 [Lecanicillium fungicola]